MRLIDADALLERLIKKTAGPANKRFTEGFNDALMRFRSMVSDAPTIEAYTIEDLRDAYRDGQDNECCGCDILPQEDCPYYEASIGR